MSIGSNLRIQGSANRPSDDSSPSGGARAPEAQPSLGQLSANSVIAVVSDGPDTRQVTIEGRVPAGTIDVETLTLNGVTEVVGTKTFERILRITTTSDSTRTVTVRQGAGGITRAVLAPNITEVYALFRNAASEAVPVDRYEKVFFANVDPSLTLNAATVKLTQDPASKLMIGVALTKNDTESVANRKTPPTGVTFVDDNVAQAVPTGFLAAGQAIGVWLKQSLVTDDVPIKSSWTLELRGSSI